MASERLCWYTQRKNNKETVLNKVESITAQPIAAHWLSHMIYSMGHPYLTYMNSLWYTHDYTRHTYQELSYFLKDNSCIFNIISKSTTIYLKLTINDLVSWGCFLKISPLFNMCTALNSILNIDETKVQRRKAVEQSKMMRS